MPAFTHPPTPMLAKEYKEKKNRLLPPTVAIQPKYDGVRCLWDKKVAWSRDNNPLPLPDGMLGEMSRLQAAVYDGEIYAHGFHFEEIQSMLKNLSKPHPARSKLRYVIYDCYFPLNREATFFERYIWLKETFPTKSNYLMLSETSMVVSAHQNLLNHRKKYIDDGYEGLMIRYPDAPYHIGRCSTLLKYKEFKDSEFTVVDIKEGKGKNKGTAVLVCRVAKDEPTAEINEDTFTVTAPGDYQDKALAWRDRDHLIGKKVTVKYQELTSHGIPRFPVALGFKEDR